MMAPATTLRLSFTSGAWFEDGFRRKASITVTSTNEIPVVIAVLLAAIGGLAAMIGHAWELTAHLVHFFFDKDLNEELGSKILKSGLVAFFVGVGLAYLLK
jgi:hypothetical protein